MPSLLLPTVPPITYPTSTCSGRVHTSSTSAPDTKINEVANCAPRYMIGPPCPHTHVVLVSNFTVYRVAVISVSSSSMRIMHVAPSTLVRASVNTDHCFVQVLWCSDCHHDIPLLIQRAGDLCLHRIQGLSEICDGCLPILPPSPTSPEACRFPHSLHSPGTILVFLGFSPAASAANEEKRICLSRRLALAGSPYGNMPTVLLTPRHMGIKVMTTYWHMMSSSKVQLLYAL